MNMESNVIDGRARFVRTGDGNVVASLEDRLAHTARVPESDRPLLASNLGKLAARIDRESALRGAKRMIEKTGHEGLWPKRKRFIRLPGEDTSRTTSDGDYGASGSTFAQLARAAGKLLATSRSPEAVAHECERALRATLEGTSFLPTFTPLSSSERTAKALVDEYANVVADAIAQRTRIVDLWNVLRDSPIGLNTRSEHESPLDLGRFGETARFPEELLRPIFRSHVVEAMFDTQNGHSFDWQEPTLEIGFIAMRFNARMFAIPEDVSSLFQRQSEDEDGFLPEAKSWLSALKAKHNTRGDFPNQPYVAGLGYGWKSMRISVLKRVGLTVTPDENGHPKLRLSTWGDESVGAFNPHGFRADAFEDRVAATAGEITQLRWIDLDEDTPLYSAHADPFDPYGDGEPSPVVGLLEYHWVADSEIYDMEQSGWSETPATASLLFGDGHRFIPDNPACDATAGPLRKGSVGAALLHNARVATEEESVVRKLIDRVRRTSDAGLRFHEALVEDYREALRRI